MQKPHPKIGLRAHRRNDGGVLSLVGFWSSHGARTSLSSFCHPPTGSSPDSVSGSMTYLSGWFRRPWPLMYFIA